MHVPWNTAGEAGSDWNQALVYGMGVSGRAAAEFLRRRDVGVIAVDGRDADSLDRGALAGDEGVSWLLGGEPEHLPAAPVDAVVLSPGVPVDRPLVREAENRGLTVISEVELAFPWLPGPLLGITGSNGKSTTTALVGAMLRAAGRNVRVCGNIGEPLTSAVDALPAADERTIFVVELSSFQLQRVDRFHPRAAALLNLTPDHLDHHPSFEDYRDSKLAIFRRQTADDLAVLNADDPRVVAAGAELPARRRWFSLKKPVADGCFLADGEVHEVTAGGEPRRLFAAADVPLPGPHNLENAMAAALLALDFLDDPNSERPSSPDLVRGLASFEGLPHRLQKVRELDGVDWYDDSKGTNPAATVKSLAGFEDGRVLLILGGIYKGGDLDELIERVREKARVVYLIGQAADVFESALARQGAETSSGPEVRPMDLLERAVKAAQDDARVGETVLLSPACSSFDQFPSFAERGRTFQRLVARLRPRREGVSHGS